MKKTIAMIILATLMISSLSLAANADNYQGIWLRTRGIITKWGTAPVYGFLGVWAAIITKNGTTHDYAQVNAMWSPAIARLDCSHAPTDNFTFSYYTAKLVELKEIDFNTSSYAVNITGLWDAYNTTTTVAIIPRVSDSSEPWPHMNFTINVTTVCEQMLTKATGVLQISGPTSSAPGQSPGPDQPWVGMGTYPFELDINGTDALTGSVWRFVRAWKEMNICDINGNCTTSDGSINLLTLVQAAKLYDARPGLGNYNQDAFDFDFNCQGYVGISDLATIAANIHP
jgi:hypothetical protein